MRESDESTGARGQGSAPVDDTTASSSAGLAGHNGEEADSRTHEETMVGESAIVEVRASVAERTIVEEIAVDEISCCDTGTPGLKAHLHVWLKARSLAISVVFILV